MKILINIICTVMILMTIFQTVDAQTETDYLDEMISAAQVNAFDWGYAAQDMRNQKIDVIELDYEKIYFDDVYYLAKIIQWEAGSSFIDEEHKLAVGEVVINRMNSTEFAGDCIMDVVFSHGSYAGVKSSSFQNMKVTEYHVRLAIRLLDGERPFDNPAVVFQANFRQGSSVYKTYSYPNARTTYFCVSSRPGIYEGDS